MHLIIWAAILLRGNEYANKVIPENLFVVSYFKNKRAPMLH